MKNTLSRKISRLALRFAAARALKDDRGVAAVEFAILLPIMILMNLALVEVTEGVRLDRKVNQLARTLADLTSQEKSVTGVNLSNYKDISKAVLAPYNPAIVKVRITSIIVRPNLTNCVNWSWASGMTAHPADAAAPNFPATLYDASAPSWQSVIMAEVQYLYAPATHHVIGSINLGERTFMRPRISDRVVLTGTLANCGI